MVGLGWCLPAKSDVHYFVFGGNIRYIYIYIFYIVQLLLYAIRKKNDKEFNFDEYATTVKVNWFFEFKYIPNENEKKCDINKIRVQIAQFFLPPKMNGICK